MLANAVCHKHIRRLTLCFREQARSHIETVVEEFRKNGTEPEGYTLYAYASIQALAAGFNGAKSNKGEDAAKWLKANPVKTVMGEKAWDAKGDLKVSDYVVYQWDKDGKYHQLEKQK